MKSFQELSLSVNLKRALERLNFSTPTPIQIQAIPLALLGKDVIGLAQTGTGKTLAFALPIVAQLEEHPAKVALILAPTREIAEQIEKVFRSLTRNMPDFASALLIGGLSMFPQIKALRRCPRIIIATPGRLVDHLERRTLSLEQAEILVLDEADRMLDMGFLPQINEVLKYLPKVRQTLLFSATMPGEISKLAAKYMQQPQKVSVGPVTRPAAKIEQMVRETPHDMKNSVLIEELVDRTGPILIFTRTKIRADKLLRLLMNKGHKVGCIHGDRSQGQRKLALEGFKEGRYRILVATDVAARGIDVPNIAHVINYDIPQSADDYIHRIGRTARAGQAGKALSLVTPDDRFQWKQIWKSVQ